MIDTALLSLGLLIIVAKLAEGVCRRFRLNSIVAYTVTGVILGPVLGLVHLDHELHLILTIGIFVFFFLIGLDEIDISSFVASLRGRYFIAAILSALISLLAAFLVTSDLVYDFRLGLGFGDALALAGVLSLTSLGIVAKVLSDDGRLKEPIGLQIFTTVIIAELLTLLVIGFQISGTGRSLGIVPVLILIGQMAGFTVVTWFLSSKVIPRVILLLERVLNVPHLSFGLFLGCLFLVVIGAEAIGLHGTLGGLLFGACLSQLPYQVRRDMMPGLRSAAHGLFIPLFFASAGLHLSLSFINLPPLTVAALVLAPLAGKFVGACIGAYATRLNAPLATAAGLMAKGVAEIALLLVLVESGVIGRDVFSLLVLVMFGYILLMPPAISFAVRRASRRGQSASRGLSRSLPASMAHFALDNFTVGDIMDRSRNHPGSSLSVRGFTERWIVPHEQDYVVADRAATRASCPAYAPLSPQKGMGGDAPEPVLRRDTPQAWHDESIEDACKRMTETALDALPVLERDTEKFLGSVTSHEILALMITEVEPEGDI